MKRLTLLPITAVLLIGCGAPPKLTSDDRAALAVIELDASTVALARMAGSDATTIDISANTETLITLIEQKACATRDGKTLKSAARSVENSLRSASYMSEANDIQAALRDAPKCVG